MSDRHDDDLIRNQIIEQQNLDAAHTRHHLAPADRSAQQAADSAAHASSHRGRSAEQTNVRGGNGASGEFDHMGCVGCITEQHGVAPGAKHHHAWEHDEVHGQSAGVVSPDMLYTPRTRQSYVLAPRSPFEPSPITSTRIRPSDEQDNSE